MKLNASWSVLALVACAVTVTGCRDSRKATVVGGGSASINVTMEGLLADDAANTGLIYEMSGCGQGTSTGVPTPGSSPMVVSFATADVKVGQQCSFVVKNAVVATDPRFKWLDMPGLAYRANKMPVTSSTSGQLQSTAILQRLYQLNQAQTYQVAIDVVFPVENALQGRNVITAQLFCDPLSSFTSIGVFTPGTGKAGAIRFVEGIGPTETRNMNCAYVDLFADGLPVYRGILDAATGKFTAKLNDTIKLGAGTVPMVNLNWASENGQIGISTRAGECPSPMTFDLKTRTCVCPFGTQHDPRTNQCY